MKRKKLKVFAVILAVTMMVTSAVGCFNFVIIAQAASGKCGDNITWSYNESTGELKISGTGAMYDYDNSHMPWSNYKYSIKKITISDGVTHIGNEAFSGCKDHETMFTEVSIGKNVKSIGTAAFNECDDIRSIVIPDSVETIGKGAFVSCQGLKSVTIGKGLRTFNVDEVWYGYKGQFDGCNRIEKFVVSPSNKYFASDSYGVLFNKDKTDLLIYPSGNSRTSYEVPGSVVNLCSYSFEKSSYLSTVKLPVGLKHIGEYAFYGCYNLGTVNIPDTVTSIGYVAFDSTKIQQTESNWEGGRQNGVLYIDNHLIELRCGGDYKVREGTVTVAINAGDYSGLYDDIGLTSLTLPDSLKYIGNGAFEGHKNLKMVKLGKNIIDIGMSAFYGCQIASVELPESVRSIGEYAFNSNRIEKIAIHENVESIGEGAFGGNPLKSIKVSTQNKNYVSIDDLALTNKDKTVFLQYAAGSPKTQYSIPEGVQTIGESAFYSANNLKNISLPKTVTVINDSAFSSSAVEKIIIPDSVTSIGNYSFSGCKNLQEVTIGTGVRTIEAFAFIDCEKLKSIFVPETVEEIGYYGTFGCYMGFTDEDYAIQVLPMKDFTLYCVKDSAAHEYAVNAKLKFVLVEGSKTGDLNSDNKINSADALIVLQSSVGTVTLTAQQKTFADVNKDDKINSSDALMILQFAVGFIDRF